MFIHMFIHSLWISPAILKHLGHFGGSMRTLERCSWVRNWLGSTDVAVVLQQFLRQGYIVIHCAKEVLALWKLDGISGFGYTLWDRFGHLGIPVEEFYEAHLPAKSSQESQNARFSQAHEHGRWTQDHRGPPPAGPQASGCLIVGARQEHTPD